MPAGAGEGHRPLQRQELGTKVATVLSASAAASAAELSDAGDTRVEPPSVEVI